MGKKKLYNAEINEYQGEIKKLKREKAGAAVITALSLLSLIGTIVSLIISKVRNNYNG